jgi:hypothetical protein
VSRALGRVASLVALLCGSAVLIAILVGQTFDRADAGEQATDLVRSELGPEGLRRHRADLELVRAAFDDLEAALPSFAAALRTDPAEFEQSVTTEYPAVGAILDDERREEGLRFAEGIVSNLEQHREDFAEADDIPVPWLPMTAGPWVGTLLAAGLVGTGLWGLLRPGAAPVVATAVLALVAIVGPLAVRFPQKATAADRLLDTLNVTPAIAAETRDILEGARAAGRELEDGLFPDLARAVGVSDTRFDEVVAEQFPDLARGREQFDAVFARYETRVRIREAGLGVVPEAKRFPLQAVTWWGVVPGAITLVAAGVALAPVARRRPRPG